MGRCPSRAQPRWKRVSAPWGRVLRQRDRRVWRRSSPGGPPLWDCPELLYIKFTSKDQTLILAMVFKGRLESDQDGYQDSNRMLLRFYHRNNPMQGLVALRAPCQRRYIKNTSGEHHCAFRSRISKTNCLEITRISLDFSMFTRILTRNY